MNLILVGNEEIVVGKPVPWTLYDQNRNPLLQEGDQVRDEAHRDALLAEGARRELSLEMPVGYERADDSPLVADAQPADQVMARGSEGTFTFDDMRLKVEDRLQLEPPVQLTRERFAVKVIGFLRGASLLVSMPITANGLRLQLKEKEKLVMRSFSGQNAFGFGCTIEKICNIPYEYMHLSFPEEIQGIMIRKAPRVKTRIIAAVQDARTGAENQLSALISDISANGVSLEARQILGEKGDMLNLAFRVQLHNIDAYLSMKGIIRAVFEADSADPPGSGLIRHGIEFQDMQVNDSVILQSLIYQQMIENPHKLI